MRIPMALAVALLAGGAAWGGDGLPAGLYAISARLELPHLERWAVDRSGTFCLATGGRALPVPVLSAGAGLAGCAARGIASDGARLSYVIACPGRDASRAAARYRLEPQGFRGRVEIVMGAKNMTMTEVQVGRRLGACTVAAGR